MSKVVEYVGFFHALKDRLKESWTQYWVSDSGDVGISGEDGFVDDRETNFRIKVKEKLERLKHQTIRRIDRSSSLDEDFSHLTRTKTRRELFQISSAVMGIEFAYAAETAFVSPLLLNIGLRHRTLTLMWFLSPLVGFFVTPLLGSMSDGCRSQLGRRRPFILLLSIGIILGLILVPNGQTIGRLLGDTYKDDPISTNPPTNLPALIPPRVQLSSTKSFPIPQSLVQLQLKTSTDSTLNEKDQTRKSISNLTLDSFLLKAISSIGNSKEKQDATWNTNSDEDLSAFKKSYSSKYTHIIEEHGFGVRNNLEQDEDLEHKEFIKTFSKKSEPGQNTFASIVEHAVQSHDDEGQVGKSNSKPNQNEFESYFNSNKLKSLKLGEGTGPREINEGNVSETDEKTKSVLDKEDESSVRDHPWGLIFTVIGTVLLDFDADACQSPSRAYMLDVTIPEDHARGLSAFTVMAGLGGCLGYILGALNWENTILGNFFGGQVRAVFTLVLFIFIACVITTIRSFREIPIDRLWAGKPGAEGLKPQDRATGASPYSRFEEDPESSVSDPKTASKSYGSTAEVCETSFNGNINSEISIPKELEIERVPTFREYVQTIVQLPKSLQWLCLTNFFCWMSLVCYSLYFTDFVGEAVFNGNPTAPKGSVAKKNYDDGVRFGCWGMSMYSLSCSIYSLCIENLISRFGAKRVYITGQLVYSVGMVFMALTRHPWGVLIFSWTAGIMYATLFTMPYILVARYHAAETFDVDIDDLVRKPNQVRGLGTDVAVVSSMVFLAQMTQALTLGSVVTAVGSTTVIICAAAVFASCGALAATKVLYLDL